MKNSKKISRYSHFNNTHFYILLKRWVYFDFFKKTRKGSEEFNEIMSNTPLILYRLLHGCNECE